MRRVATSIVASLLLAGWTIPVFAAFQEDTPPTLSNGSADPEMTADPAVVASAQRALESFFEYTNQAYGPAGFANAWLMREEVGNRQDHWLDRVLPLACGRLISGWKSMNWVPNTGWRREAPALSQASWSSVDCEFSPPSFANGGANPDQTADPPAVRAAQASLIDFYRTTNRAYSTAGYSNAWAMREERGNSQSAWLDMTLPLARGQLQGGWRNMNWVPGKGWQHSSISGPVGIGLSLAPSPAVANQVVAWTPDRASAAPLPPDLGRIPRKPAELPDTGLVARIADSSGLPRWLDPQSAE